MKTKRTKRWLAPWRDSLTKPAIYHCINRVVDRQFVLGADEREKFRTFMRMYENFSGCRVLSYCIMSNHFHLLLEVPPMPKEGLSEAEFQRRLEALYKPGKVREIIGRIETFREAGDDAAAAEVVSSYTRRMHDLSEFMRSVTQRFSRWFNRTHERTGTLWEKRFKSVLVESGTAARTMASYIDLNPVRAGMVSDPAKYRWSSYGEALGGGARGGGRKAKEGLVRAMRSADGIGFEVGHWAEASLEYRRWMDMALERNPGRLAETAHAGEGGGSNEGEGASGFLEASEWSMARMLSHRVRYFTDGAVIGSRGFIDEVFRAKRERFGPKRKTGARKLRGAGAAAGGTLWSLRDLRDDTFGGPEKT